MFFRKKKKDVNFVNTNERLQYDNDSFEYNKNRAAKIADSEMDLNDKLNFLDINKKFDYSISENITRYGLTLLNILQNIDEDDFGEEGVDDYGNTFIDFLDNDNNFAFNEMEKIINSCYHGGRRIKEELYNKFKFILFVRNTLIDIHTSIPEPSDDMDNLDELKNLLYTFIATCAKYGVSYYKNRYKSQEQYLEEQFDMVKVLFYDYLEDFSYKDTRWNWRSYIKYLY